MILWGDEPSTVETHLMPAQPFTECEWYGGVCMRRAKLKRAVHETHQALDSAGSQAAHRVAERAYHTALYALANHSCVLPEDSHDI